MIDPANPDYTNTPVSPQRSHFNYAPADPSAPPCVTIVTPFYNPGPVFDETARSVLQQSFQQWEWVIVNDGSTDPQSLALLEHYRRSDPRIRVIDHDGNRGPGAARNTGFRHAQTPYVVQLDSDDLLEPTAVEKWVWFLESYPEFAFVKGYSVGFGAQNYLWREGFHSGDAFLEENLVDTNGAVRKTVHQAVDGYDEAMRGGLEDWDFWLRCASVGYWGGTLPEYLDWYRRRPRHGDRWPDWDRAARQRALRTKLRHKYAHLWNGGFPTVQLRQALPHDAVPDTLPYENLLHKKTHRLLLLVPWLTLGGADKFNLDLVEQLTHRGWEVTIATTLKGDHSWLPAFARHTPDIFILHHFLRLVDYPRFVRYLIASRQVDVVLVSNSELSYLLLPYLRAHFPEVTFVDFCHMEEEYWKNGGYPRLSVEYQELLDLQIVASAHLKRWMVTQGAEPQRLQVCYINIDPARWRPDPQRRTAVRQELEIPDEVPVILFAGRLCDQKQPRVLAQTVLQLCRRRGDVRTLIAGNGPEFDWLRTFLRRHGLGERVRVLGGVSSQRVQELMTAADIFFLPSRWEGIALSIYEAMACGLPVVGADVGGQRELVTPDCGALLPRSDEETETVGYVEVLEALLRDPQRRQQMGQAGRKRVEVHFRLDHMAERMLGLLQEAMRLHRDDPRPVPSLSVGRVCATQAIEYARLTEVADRLWQEREHAQAGFSALPPPVGGVPAHSWRVRTYFALRRHLLPYYRAALERGGRTWLFPLKERVKRALLS
jgi:glycosyltransferase involved in cell wall biosynthesis